MGNVKSILIPSKDNLKRTLLEPTYGALMTTKDQLKSITDPKVTPVPADETSKDELATEISAKEAARIETARLKKKKGFRSTILTSPLGDTNTPPLKKAEIL